MVAPQNKPKTDAWMALYMTVAKLTDSGLGIFVVIAITIIGLGFALTWGLDSKDRLTLLEYIFSLKLLAWGGWLIAAIAISLASRLLKDQRKFFERELQRVNDVKEKAIAAAQQKLDLPDSNSDKK
jgi:hypothetical protein